MSDRFRIRDYRPADFGPVQALWEAVDMGGLKRGDTAEVIDRTLRQAQARFFVLEAPGSGDIAGTSWITCDGRRLLLHHFAVKPEYQGRGLSKLLLEASLRHAREAGLPIKLEVARNNLRAVELYKKAGFKSLGDYEVYILRDVKGRF